MADICNCNCDDHSLLYQSPIELSSSSKNLILSTLNFSLPDTNIMSKYNPIYQRWDVLNDVIHDNNDIQYKLVEYHLHSPGEHKIDDQFHLAEIHFVFKNIDQDAFLVISYLIDLSSDSSSHVFYNILLDLPFSLPKWDKYFTYPGSLTTSPFNVNINWIVNQFPIHITSDFYALLKNKFKSARPIQKRNGRNIALIEIIL
jgi:carbonic anhydrase